jgi:hypothetical protein
MSKIIALLLISAALGGCAALFGDPDDGLSPSAFIGAHVSRCESQARLGSGATTTTIGLTQPRGDFDSMRDINRTLYWNCAKAWP